MGDLTREDVARLRAWIAAAQDPRETPWALIHPEVAEWLATKGDALLALAEAVEGAPVLCHRLHTSDGKNAWRWVDGPPNQQAQDDAKNFGWKLELAYGRLLRVEGE